MTATSPLGTHPDATFVADVEALDATWREVAATTEVHDTWLEVAGELVRLRLAGGALSAALLPALGHLVVDPPAAADVERAALVVHAWDSVGSGTRLPDMALLPVPGDIAAPTSHAFGDGAFWLQPVDAVLSALRRRTAWWCVPASAGVAPPERAAPFKAIFHWWLAGRGLHLVHAGAVGSVDGAAGVLLPGPGGAGKSTTVARCARAGLPVAGDDFVIVGTDPPRVWSLYGTVKLMPSVAHEEGWPVPRLPDCGEKRTLLLDDVRTGSVVAGLPLTTVALPRVVPSATATDWVPARPAEVVMALAPWTLLQLPMPRQEAFAAAREIAERVPAVTLRLGSDPAGVTGGVAALLAGATDRGAA